MISLHISKLIANSLLLKLSKNIILDHLILKQNINYLLITIVKL